MAESYPATLQQLLNSGSFSYSFGKTTLRTQMDIGPAKVRNRFTNGIDGVSASIDMDYDIYSDLETFYKTTLANGAKTFLFDHPFSGVESEWRFKSAPTLSPISGGGRQYRVTLQWELLG